MQLKLAPASIRTMFNLLGFLQNLAEPKNSSLLRLEGSWGYETAPKKKKLSRPYLKMSTICYYLLFQIIQLLVYAKSMLCLRTNRTWLLYHVNQHLESYLLSLSGFLKLEISAFGEIWDESLEKQAACRSVGSVF